jgi:hypothetical protein
MIAAAVIAAAATLPLAAVASACGGHVDVPADAGADFITPSGNIACSIYSDNTGASCEVLDHTWIAPESTMGPFGRACDFTFGGLEVYVSQAKEAKVGCYEGVSKFIEPGYSTKLDYGQSIQRGKMTCSSEASGVTCTDTATGHFFRVSRENYQLG